MGEKRGGREGEKLGSGSHKALGHLPWGGVSVKGACQGLNRHPKHGFSQQSASPFTMKHASHGGLAGLLGHLRRLSALYLFRAA